MAKIFFHCGAHKTASTHLQYNLKLNREYLEQKGIAYFRFHEIKGMRQKAVELRENFNQSSYHLNQTIDYLKSSINNEIKDYDYVIVSYEGAFGDIYLQRQKAIYPEVRELIEIYGQIFQHHEVTPIYVTRNYMDFILSSYKMGVNFKGFPFSLSQYAKEIQVKENCWTNIIESLSETFTTPIVWTYENYKGEAPKILYELLRKIKGSSINFEALEFSSERKNSGQGPKMLAFHYTVNKLFKKSRYLDGIKIRINDYFDEDKIFFKGLLKNPIDGQFQKRNKASENYDFEIESLKENKQCIFID